MKINHGGTTNAHGACTVRYGTRTIHGGSRRDQSWSSVAKPWMIRRTTVQQQRTQFVVNRERSWCQRFHRFATELHDWLRSLTNSREYSYGVFTNKHDSATVALQIRPRPITTTARHDTP